MSHLMQISDGTQTKLVNCSSNGGRLMDHHSVFGGPIRKLSSLQALSDGSVSALLNLPWRPRRVMRGTVIVSDGQLITECCLLLKGYACRSKMADDGGRQIVSFHLAGDILDIQHLLFERADHSVQAISDAELAFVPITALRMVAAEHPDIAAALWRDCLVDASIFREWVLNVGRRDAKKRVAHMLCEFAVRAEAAGLGSRECFTLPMTQEDIADATGLTSVHVNRTLRILSEEGAIARHGREIRIADWQRMRRTADFSPEYLHLAP
jgi:CRP-like cAMP-binding protein